MDKVKEMEGLVPDDSPIPGDDLEVMAPQYRQALGYLFELNHGYLVCICISCMPK